MNQQILRSDQLCINTLARKVTLHGKELALTPTSFELLCCLVTRSPEVVSVDELLQQIWRGKVVTRETVKQQIKTLRGQLKEAGERVESVRGFGYRIVALNEPESNEFVSSEPELQQNPPENIQRQYDSAKTPEHRWQSKAALITAMAIVAITAIIFTVSGILRNEKLPLPLVIAVLPFENLDQEGRLPKSMPRIIQDQLTTSLAQQNQIRTLSLAVVDPSHKSSLTPSAYLQQFNVHMLIEGSMRNHPRGVSVNIRIVWTRTGMTAWRENIIIEGYDEDKILENIENVLLPFARKKVNWIGRKNKE